MRNLNPVYEPQQEIAAGTRLDVPEKVAGIYEKSCANGKWVALASELNAAALPVVAQTKSSARPTGKVRSYVVRKGDTIASIAHRHACGSSSELVAINHLKPPHYALQVGQNLQIPSVCSRN